MCTVLRGHVERSGGDAEAFEALVRARVPYHPAGRLPERKISNPAASVPGPALDGEQALVERLSAMEDTERRVAHLFEEDEAGLAARLEDPFELGPLYDPAVSLGADASWDALAAWPVDPTFGGSMTRAIPARWVLLEGRAPHASGWLPAMASVLGPTAALLPWTERDAAGLAESLRALAPAASDRLVLVAEEAAVPLLLEALVAHATLRDQVLAVLSIAGVIGGRTDEEGGPLGPSARRDWMEAHFDQAALDTEVVRLTPYLAVQRLARGVWPPGLPGLPLQAQRFPEPAQGDATVATLETVDLGPLWAEGGPDPDHVARALVAVVAGWVASRR